MAAVRALRVCIREPAAHSGRRMKDSLALFRTALDTYDRRTSEAVSDELLHDIVMDARDDHTGTPDKALVRLVCSTAYNVAHEAILGG